MTDQDLTKRLDGATADRRLLDHPFYKAWSAGTLTTDDLRFYSTQYWRQVEAFPGYLEDAAARLPQGSSRTAIEENLADERDDDHPGLWLRFAAALGADEASVRSAAPEPETAACVESFRNAMQSAPLPYALGMLYAYESQTPEVADTKVKGLRENYGIDGEPVEYFSLHGELDVEHSAELADVLADVCTDDESRGQAVAGAAAGAEAVWGLLSGVTRARDIC